MAVAGLVPAFGETGGFQVGGLAGPRLDQKGRRKALYAAVAWRPGLAFRRLNSVARGLPMGLGVHRRQVGLSVIAVFGNAALQSVEVIVLEFAVQFV